MEQKKLENGMDGRDALRDKDGEVMALLSALPRVEAPGNFEFGVRARIAAHAARPRQGFVPFLKLAAPLALLLIVTGLVFFYGTMSPTDVPVVADEKRPAEIPTARTPEVARGNVTAQVSDPGAAGEKVGGKLVAGRRNIGPIRTVNNANSGRPRNDRGGSIDMPGSIDTTLGVANTIVAPGFESATPRRSVNANVGSGTDVPVREVLGILGITPDFAGGVCRISAVADNSLGARAGMKANDVIETIDGREVKSDTKLRGDSGPKNFNVRRDGKRVSLTMGN